jgi:hypothetical protein
LGSPSAPSIGRAGGSLRPARPPTTGCASSRPGQFSGRRIGEFLLGIELLIVAPWVTPSCSGLSAYGRVETGPPWVMEIDGLEVSPVRHERHAWFDEFKAIE